MVLSPLEPLLLGSAVCVCVCVCVACLHSICPTAVAEFDCYLFSGMWYADIQHCPPLQTRRFELNNPDVSPTMVATGVYVVLY